MRTMITLTPLLALALVLAAGVSTGQPTEDAEDPCMTCHRGISPGLYGQWKESRHAENGVGCLECHGAAEGEADAFEHHDEWVATLVTPGDCGQCHETETEEVASSYHATAGRILDSKDAYLAHVVGGLPVAILGCESCHGAKVQIDPASPNRLARNSWPNSGIGRINPDGTLGACSACHTRHAFSKAQARQPEACSKCHLGPDHPQKEVYEESKHGNVYFTNVDRMNLDSDSWVVGRDYFTAPTCATCHISAAESLRATHDVGKRIAWTLRPPVSKHTDEWQTRRADMEKVCSACHGSLFVGGQFHQYDATVRLYNEKFALPATTIINMLREKGLLERKASFSNKVEWTYWELWHHEGRRARHGAAMMGPDYTWWHGFYEVGQHFYFKLIPEARKYGDAEVNAYIDKLLTEDPMHRWMTAETPELKEAIRTGELQKIYEELFTPTE